MIGLKQKLDYSDYAAVPDDGCRYEMVDGGLLVTPAPSPLHQRVSKRLQRCLEAYFEQRGLGEVFDAPVDVILTPHDVVQPDLVVVSQPTQVSERGIEGAPLLAVEILSPTTRERDRTIKARRYSTLGIAHYWIVDPEARGVECYALQGPQYVLCVEGQGPITITHPHFAQLTLPLSDLWL
ncbi:MAG: Uma2 family endonuclease [Nitrospira sp.]|nr:Uma2 family endonuclease [Nitrospira sp.]